MRDRKDNLIKVLLRICVSVVVLLPLAGCVSTSSDASSDDDNYEQKNLEIAYGFLTHGYPQKAISRLEKILERNSRSSRAYGVLGVVYQQQGEYALAEKNFEKALDLNSEDSGIRNNYGTLLFETGRYDEAEEAFEEVTQDIYYDNRSRAFENLGFVALKQGEKTEAKERFSRALRLQPNLAASSLELARIYFSEGYYPEAFKHYQQFDVYGQQTPDSLWLGIRVARAVDQMPLAFQYASTLSKLYPGSDEYREYRRRYND